MIPDANAETILASLQTPKAKRGMLRILSPQMIVLDGEVLNFRWQRLEKIPEAPGSNRFHLRGGQSRRGPFADSLSASSKRKSSLPALESAST